jgi:hypothetical protein
MNLDNWASQRRSHEQLQSLLNCALKRHKGIRDKQESKLSLTISNPYNYVFTKISKLALKVLNSLALEFSDKSFVAIAFNISILYKLLKYKFLVPWGIYLQIASILSQLILSFGTLREQIAQLYPDTTYRLNNRFILLILVG